MPSTLHCTRCSRTDAPAMERAPIPGPVGRELLARVCGECWREWQKMEVMVINELRLNFMDPGAQETLDGHMRAFLSLTADPT